MEPPPAAPWEFWLACAGPFALPPPVGTKVYYFPRGHADQCRGADLPNPPAEDAPEQAQPAAAAAAATAAPVPTDARYFVKDVGDKGNPDRAPFHIPRRVAELLFPPLQMPMPRGDSNTQLLQMFDGHGTAYDIKHVLDNKAKYFFSAGWNNYAQKKKMKMGENGVVVMRSAHDGFLLGPRRDGPSADLAAEMINDALHVAQRAAGDPFTVTYFPRQGWPFVVPTSLVDEARSRHWQPGMMVRMTIPEDPHELKDSRDLSKILPSYHGVIDAVNNSIWTKLEVNWEVHSTPNAYTQRDVNIWQVEVVGQMEAIEPKVEPVE